MSQSAIGEQGNVYPYGIRHTPEMIADLSRRAYEYRLQVLGMIYGRKSGHPAVRFRLRRSSRPSTFII